MAQTADNLAAMTVTVTSPDGRIKARIRHPGEFTVGFAPNAYQAYSTSDLAHQLSRLCDLGMTGFVRGYRRATDRPETDPEHPDPRSRRYREELKHLFHQAASPHNLVKISTTGMMDWQVRIRPGALEELHEPEFISELIGAVHGVLADHQSQIIKLKDKHFSLSLPAFVRKLPPAPAVL